MTRADTLTRLADRVEGATGADRGLDAEIAPIMGLRVVDEGHPLGRVCYNGDHRAIVLPRYTASLDAAMGLVPEGWSIQMHLSENGMHPCVILGRSYPTNARIAQEGHTLSATVCAAALRAHAALAKE